MSKPQKKPIVIGSIPLNWQVPTIESVCKIKSSAMSYKQLLDAPNVHNGIRVIGVKVSDMNLPGNKIKFHSANLERNLDEKDALKRTVPKNSIVFPKRGAAIATNKKRMTVCETVLDPNLIAVTPSDTVDHKYLFYWFNTFDLKRITAPGPTPQLNKKDIAPLKFPLPPLPEQKKIALVLTTVQRAIEAQEQIIQTTAELKKALMHKLFTEGLRSEPQKRTEIGLVPESWGLVDLGEIINLFAGYAFKSKEGVSASNTQLLRMGNLYQNSLDLSRKPIFYPDSFTEDHKRFVLKEGDMVMSLTGTSGKEDYGFTVRIPRTEKTLLLNQRVTRIDITDDGLQKDFAHHFLLSRKFLDFLYPTAKGMKQANLSTNAMKQLKVVLPDGKEQSEIATCFNSLDRKIVVAGKKRDQLQDLFRTLLHELMTAKTRVVGISITTTT